jgi:hypothetical protein
MLCAVLSSAGEASMIRSALFSANPVSLAEFYKSKGLNFIKIAFEHTESYVSTNSSLSIFTRPSNSSSLGGLVSYGIAMNYNNALSIDYDDQGYFAYVQANIDDDHYNLIYKTDKNNWITVMRSSDIERTKSFYEYVGQGGLWVKEKHGSGPEHYALVDQNHVFEIYPCRKSNPQTVEFMVQNHQSTDFEGSVVVHKSPTLQDLDGRSIYFIN